MASIEYSNELHFWLEKGTFYYQSGNYEEALIAFNKVISVDAKNAEAWYLRGKSLILLLEIDDGIKSFDTALSIEPNNQDVKKFRNLASNVLYRHFFFNARRCDYEESKCYRKRPKTYHIPGKISTIS